MLWEDWLANIAPSLNVTTNQAGVIMAIVFTWGMILIAIIASPKNARYSTPVISVIMILLFTYAGWYPLYTGTALGFIAAIAVVYAAKGA